MKPLREGPDVRTVLELLSESLEGQRALAAGVALRNTQDRQMARNAAMADQPVSIRETIADPTSTGVCDPSFGAAGGSSLVTRASPPRLQARVEVRRHLRRVHREPLLRGAVLLLVVLVVPEGGVEALGGVPEHDHQPDVLACAGGMARGMVGA